MMIELSKLQLMYIICNEKEKSLKNCENCKGKGVKDSDEKSRQDTMHPTCQRCEGTGLKNVQRFDAYIENIVNINPSLSLCDWKKIQCMMADKDLEELYKERLKECIKRYEVDVG